MIYKKKKINFE